MSDKDINYEHVINECVKLCKEKELEIFKKLQNEKYDEFTIDALKKLKTRIGDHD